MSAISLKRLLLLNLYYWVAILVLSLLASLQYSMLHNKPYDFSYLPATLASELVVVLLTGALVVWSYQQLQRQQFSSWRLVGGVALLAAVYIPLDNAFWMWMWGEKIADLRMLISNLDTSVLAFFVWAACFLTVLLYQQQLARLAQTHALSQKIQQLELQALSHQLNPHFTFNTLNSVCALIESDRYDDAETMSEQLATFLRYSLSKSPQQLVQLADELSAINAYLQLQKTRFGDKLKVNWQVDQSLTQQKVPALLLQPLVEKAIKYAVATRRQGATITIGGKRHANSLHLSVADDGPGSSLDTQCGGAGVGLNNIRNRLMQHFGDNARLDVGATPTGFTVDIHIPWQVA